MIIAMLFPMQFTKAYLRLVCSVVPLLVVSMGSQATFSCVKLAQTEQAAVEKQRLPGQAAGRWELREAGDGATGAGIVWEVQRDQTPHGDNIEMAGRKVVGIIDWTIDEKQIISVNRKIIFPQIHPVQKTDESPFQKYRAYLTAEVGDPFAPAVVIEGKQLTPGPVKTIQINGTLTIQHQPVDGLELTRHFFPSTTDRIFFETWTLKNVTQSDVDFRVLHRKQTIETLAWDGKSVWSSQTNAPASRTIAAGDSFTISLAISAANAAESLPQYDVDAQLEQRLQYLNQVSQSLVLETPDPVLNELFRFSKIRASESIFESKLGLVHSPGGGRYYLGIWANDQAEYVSPFFAYLDYELGHKSAMNCYRAFAKQTNPEYRPLPYSFEVEALVPSFYRDRGDAAMIAFGAAHYALASGSRQKAIELWPLIEWCLEYCHRQLNDQGVVKSETDEMEGRIETGSANLSTSVLYYGGLEHAIDLAVALNLEDSKIESYRQHQAELRKSIESYFGATVEGLDTYRYYQGHQHLRHWICLPLVVGIFDRKDATIEALFDRLWSGNGVHVEKNSASPEIGKIFWDRGTLYALRGALIAGATERAMEKLTLYSRERLLGQRVPYVVEAFPEGGMAHLSAESGLYCRVFTEGLFGIKPIALNAFSLTPRLPVGWPEMSLGKINAFGKMFDIAVVRAGDQIEITVTESVSRNEIFKKQVEAGNTVRVDL